MHYKIEHSTLAEQTLRDELYYVIGKFGLKSGYDFLEKIESVNNILLQDPYIFQKHNNNTFKIVIVKQITMYYSVHMNTIEVLLFWNNNKNPINLKKLL